MFPEQVKGLNRGRPQGVNTCTVDNNAEQNNEEDSVKKVLMKIDEAECVAQVKQRVAIEEGSTGMSEEEFLQRFDIPVEVIKGQRKPKSKVKDKRGLTVTFIIHVLTLIGGLTLLGIAMFSEVSAFIVLFGAVILTVLLYLMLGFGNKVVVNIVSTVITLIFAGALTVMLQNIGVLVFGKCSLFSAGIVTVALLFISLVTYFLITGRKGGKVT